MTYAVVTVDRRAAYYARIAGLIAADPLDFYARAEKGRRILAHWTNEVPRTTSLPSALPCATEGGGKVVRLRRKSA